MAGRKIASEFELDGHGGHVTVLAVLVVDFHGQPRGGEHPDFILVLALEFAGAVQLVAENVTQRACVDKAFDGFFHDTEVAWTIHDEVYIALFAVHVQGDGAMHTEVAEFDAWLPAEEVNEFQRQRLDAVRILHLQQTLQAVLGNKNLCDVAYGGADEFLVSVGTEVEVVREVAAEGFYEGLVVFGGVEFFCAEQFFVAEPPCTLQHFHVEERLVLGGDVFEERENSFRGVFVA